MDATPKLCPKEFEQQVERIFRVLEDDDTTVTWNWREPDPDTGQSRQIDVRIHRRNGQIVHVECRNRTGKQDVEWIETLIGRRASLRIDAIAGISASGFTEPARKKAEKHGISIWQLGSIEGSDIRLLVHPPRLSFPVFRGIASNLIYYVQSHQIEAAKEELSYVVGRHFYQMAGEEIEFFSDVTLLQRLPRTGELIEASSTDFVQLQASGRTRRVIGRKFRFTLEECQLSSIGLRRKSASEIVIDAEAQIGEFHGASVEMVVGPAKWAVNVNLAKLRMPQGSIIGSAFMINSPETGGKKLDLRIIRPEEMWHYADGSYEVRVGF